MQKTIMVFSAHPDDEVFGCGGTMIKYSKNTKIISVIFSYGENSHFWMKSIETIQKRVKEMRKAANKLKTKKTIFLGIKEKDFIKESKTHKVRKIIKNLIKRYDPKIVFTHSEDDIHPLHRAVNSTIKSIIEDYNKENKCELYTFDVWTIFNFKDRQKPKLYVDITDQFEKKLETLNVFKSQKMSLIMLLWTVYLKTWIAGLKINVKRAERFYKEI